MGPVSSLKDDRDGDKLSDKGIESLVGQVKNEPIGLHPNHGMDPGTGHYDWRDVFGAWEDAEVDNETTMAKVRLERKIRLVMNS